MKMRDFRKLRFNNIFLQLQVTVGLIGLLLITDILLSILKGLPLGLLLLLMLMKMYSTLMSML